MNKLEEIFLSENQLNVSNTREEIEQRLTEMQEIAYDNGVKDAHEIMAKIFSDADNDDALKWVKESYDGYLAAKQIDRALRF